LEDEIGIKLGTDFTHYQRFHPLFPTASTPPGNWLFLRRAKEVYDEWPSGRDEIKSLIRSKEGIEKPMFGGRESHRINEIQKRAEQDGAGQPATRSESQ
jgi:hypothetical protein